MARLHTRRFAGAALLLSLLGSTSALAQSAGAPAPDQTTPPQTESTEAEPPAAEGFGDELVVTARQRSESLVSVPVAVTAVTGLQLQRTGATDLIRIAQLAPQVMTVRTGSGGGASFVIRGIGSQPQEPNLDQTVAINVDGVLINRGRAAQLGLYDLQQVEILKGPQALFFGKNSPAGVISIISAGPTDTFSGYVKAGYEFEARERFVEGAVSGPLGGGFKARIAARYDALDGWITNSAVARPAPYAPTFTLPGSWAKRVPGGDEKSARLTLVYDPDDSAFDATLRVFGVTHDDNDGAGGQQLRCIAPTTIASSYGQVDPTSDCRFDNNLSKTATPEVWARTIPVARDGKPYTDLSAVIAGLTLNYRPSDTLTITSITGGLHLRSKIWGEYAGISTSQVWSGSYEETDTRSQELRLISSFDGPLNFTLGGFYENSYRETFAAQLITFRGIDPATGKYDTSERIARNKSDSYSAFAQLRYAITPELELAGGARVTREVKSTDIFTTYVAPAVVAAQAVVGQVISVKYRDTNISPEATLTWHPTPGQTLYAAYKTGYKSGGFANPTTLSRIFQTSPNSLRLEAEEAEGGEIGYKAYLFDRTVRLETAIYSYDFSNLQVSSYDTASASFQVRNAAKARTRGIEASVNWQATPEFNLNIGGGYNRAKYVNFPTAPCYLGQTAAEGCLPTLQGGRMVNAQDFGGRQLHRAPRFSLTAQANYDVPISETLTIGFSGDVLQSSSYNAQENLAPAGFQEGYWKFGAGARIGTIDPGWELAFIARNITNEFVITQGSDQPGGTKGSTTVVGPRPRELLLQGTFRF